MSSFGEDILTGTDILLVLPLSFKATGFKMHGGRTMQDFLHVSQVSVLLCPFHSEVSKDKHPARGFGEFKVWVLACERVCSKSTDLWQQQEQCGRLNVHQTWLCLLPPPPLSFVTREKSFTDFCKNAPIKDKI